MIKFITSFLSLLWILLIGTPTRDNDLRKQPTKSDYNAQFYNWVERHFGLIALAARLILLAIFVTFCFLIVGVSATESGAMRNFINGGVI